MSKSHSLPRLRGLSLRLRANSSRRLAAALLVAAMACDSGESTGPFPASVVARPNVVLVVLDTVRRDHLSLYGYERKTSPKLDLLAEESRVYDNAHSTSNWTAASHASLFTGYYPIAHGVSHSYPALDLPIPTLAEILLQYGYETHAVVSNAVLRGSSGFARGFEEYDEPWVPHFRELARTQGLSREEQLRLWSRMGTLDRNGMESVEQWLDARSSERPFFLFLNLIGAHSPYLSAGPFQNTFDSSIQRTPELEDLLWRFGKSPKWYATYYLGREDISPDDLDFVMRSYDAELLYVDHQLGTLMRLLKDRDLWQDTLVIVTADHGEAFGENEIIGHDFVLHDVLTRIPLVIRYPDRFAPGTRDASPVQIHDLFATILEIAGVDLGRHPSQGISLASGEVASDRPILSEVARNAEISGRMATLASDDDERRRAAFYDRASRSILCGDFKFIESTNGEHELYQRSSDPGETRNLYRDPEYARQVESCSKTLAGLMQQHLADRPERSEEVGAPELEPIERSALRALGYIE